MSQETKDVSSEQEDLIFPSKRDAWIVAVLWLIILVSAAGAIAALTMSLSIVSLLVQEVMWIGIIVFCFSILRSTYYVIKTESLLVRTGPFKWTILFEDIEEVVPSRKAWSSASLSMDRLYIDHKSSTGGTYISPEDKQVFLAALAERTSALQLDGERLVRITTDDPERG
jgi:hypothetical protein